MITFMCIDICKSVQGYTLDWIKCWIESTLQRRKPRKQNYRDQLQCQACRVHLCIKVLNYDCWQ